MGYNKKDVPSRKDRLVVNEYFCWLMDAIDMDVDGQYSKLMECLFTYSFVYFVPHDEDRAEEGLELRNRFEEETNFRSYIALEGYDCTILEMLVSLAQHWENDIMYDFNLGDRTSKWFWVMICNLKLDIFDDYSFDSDEVYEILDIFMYRKYGFDGQGGLFPLHNPPKNQKKVDIWYQLQSFILENYNI